MEAVAGDRRSLLPTRRAFWKTTAATTLVTGGIVYTMGATTLFFLLVAGFVLIGPFVVVGLAVTSLTFHSKPPSQRSMSGTAQFLLLVWVVAIQFIGLFAGVHLDRYRSSVAREWCDSLAPRLEAWYAEQGEYPRELALLGVELNPPRYCRDGGLMYVSRPDGYVLDFFDDGWLSGWAYSSTHKTWSHYD